MEKVNFTKMVASGNDFVVVEDRGEKAEVRSLSELARKMCDRKFGIGADGLLLLGKSKRSDLNMRIFNSDGSEAEMCGNGARCTAFYVENGRRKAENRIIIETRAGLIEAYITGNNVKIKLTDPKDIKSGIPLEINGRSIRVNFINTGVPHTIIFVEGINKINVGEIGRQVRYHEQFSPQGTNVDFVEILSKDSIKIRTYERGVEGETLACGTGSVASALLYALNSKLHALREVNVHTESGEILKVYFEKEGNNFSSVWLEGKAEIVYRGEYYV